MKEIIFYKYQFYDCVYFFKEFYNIYFICPNEVWSSFREIIKVEIRQGQSQHNIYDQSQDAHAPIRGWMARKYLRDTNSFPDEIHVWLHNCQPTQSGHKLRFLTVFEFSKLHKIHRRLEGTHFYCPILKAMSKINDNFWKQSRTNWT